MFQAGAAAMANGGAAMRPVTSQVSNDGSQEIINPHAAAMVDRPLAAERIARAIRAGERIVVFGDYDVDGTTSACILADVIEALGGDVVALVANRFEGGYGFSHAALDRCREAGARLIGSLAPKLVVPTHHDAFFAPLERGLHLLPGIDLEGFVSEVFTRAPHASVITPDYEEPICVPPGDARGAVLAAS